MPFDGKSKDQSSAEKTNTEPARPEENPVEDAEYAEPDTQEPNPVEVEDSRVPKAPELTFEFDPTDDEDEEDLLK